jgi:hypothetical protein
MMMTEELFTPGFSGFEVAHYSLSGMTLRETDSASTMSF